MEAMSVEQRLERLEKLAGITGPAICSDPTGEGSAWQGSPAPAEPAPGSDADHPPEGYRLAKVDEAIHRCAVVWSYNKGPWKHLESWYAGMAMAVNYHPIANPIPANEGDSQKAWPSDKIAESVVQDLQQACYDRAELRATVERLTAERDELRGKLAKVAEVLG